MPPIVYLIDGHALAYRAFFALSSSGGTGFVTRQGEPTAGVYGFTSILLRILDQEHPPYLAVAFDTGRTFRDDLFPDYKATRAKMPDELRPQIERIRQLVDAFNIPRLEIEGYEADDVLGSAAYRLADQGLGVKIITGDRDLLQLVGPRVIVNLPGKSLSDSRDYLPEDVVAFLGVRPDQVVDYKALVGDKSDNIPGVAGIGEKTAVSLLHTYDNLDNLYAHLAELPAGVAKKLEAGREAAYLSRKLAAIVTDLDIVIDLEAARTENFDPTRVEALFRELEFRSLFGRLQALQRADRLGMGQSGQQLSLFPAPEAPAVNAEQLAAGPTVVVQSGRDERRVVVVDTPEKLEALQRQLSAAQQLSFDTETTSTDQMRAELVGIALAMETGTGYYLPVGHQGAQQLPLQQALEALRRPLEDPHLPKVGHNLKYDVVVLRRQGVHPAGLAFDTMIAEWLINPASRNLGLKNLAWVRQNIHMTSIEELIGKGKKQLSMAQVAVDQAAAYAVADAEVVLRLRPELERELRERQAEDLFHQVEMPLILVLADMEMAGVALDTDFLKQMSVDLQGRLAEIEAQIYADVGITFNLNSPQQLSEALFQRLRLSPPDRSARTATGFYSTSAEVLASLRGQHRVIDLILEYRELAKLKSTYVDTLPLQVNPYTGRVHTSYNQTGSVTGRLASSDPNLQNIPIRTEVGREVRKAFVAGPGNMLLSADYSQIELRLVAHMADDQAMLAAFRQGLDIHAATAAAIYGIPVQEVTPEQRRRAKAINFGLIYGMGSYGLTLRTDLTLAEAQNFTQMYFQQYPAVKAYLDGLRRLAAQQGYVETLLGRRRYFPGLKNLSDRAARDREEREAINAPIQGTAADIMKLAMLQVPRALKQAGLAAQMILQVHDELVLECPAAEVPETAAVVRKTMESVYTLKIPLLTEAKVGANWGEMSPL